MYARDDVATAERWQSLPSGELVDAAAESFRLLGDVTRLRLLWLLCGADYDVTTLARAVAIARPAVSQHLAKLRLAGLVAVHREGRRAVYRARGGHVRNLLTEAVNAATHRTANLPDHD